jgi:hypothetical protein
LPFLRDVRRPWREITSFDSGGGGCSQIVLSFIDSFVFVRTVKIKAEMLAGNKAYFQRWKGNASQRKSMTIES